MPNFIEQATLKLIDQASSPARKINRELNSLLKTANKFKSVDFKPKGLTETSKQLRRLTKDVERLRDSTKGRSLNMAIPAVSQAGINRVNRMTEALKALNREAARSHNAVGRVNVQRDALPRPRPPGAVPIVPMGRAQEVPIRVNAGPLKTVLDGFVQNLGHRITNAVITGVTEGFKRGTTDIDVAETRIALQDIPTDQRGMANRIARDVAQQFPVFSRGSALGLISELFPVVRGQTEAVRPITEELAKFTQLRVSLKESAEQAVDSAVELAKAGEQMGAFTTAAGDVDPTKVKQFFDTINRSFVMVGREATPELIRGLVKNLRTAKFSLDEEGLISAILFAEEMRTSAGVGINQMIKQLTGERIKEKQLDELIRLGLIQPKEVNTGTVGGKRSTKIVGDGAVEEELLRENPTAWVAKHIIPRMTQQGMDPNKPTDVAKFAGAITSDRTATEMLTAMIIRSQEILDQVKRAKALDVSDKRLTGVMDQSLTLSWEQAKEQFVGVLGEVGNAFETILIPVLKGTAKAANFASRMITDEDGSRSYGGTALVLGGVAGAGLLAGKGGGALLNMFNPLNTSATNLNAAATALTRAATALQGGSAIGGDGGKSKSPSLFGGWSSIIALLNLSALARREPDWEAATKRSAGWNVAIEGFLDRTFGAKFTDLLVKRQSEFDADALALPGQKASSIQGEINRLTAEIQRVRESEPFQEIAAMQIAKLEEDRSFLTMQLESMSAEGAGLFEQAFSTGADRLDASATAIQSAGEALGPAIQSAIGAGGEQAAAAIRNAMNSPVNVSVTATPARQVDTGALVPN